MKMRVQDIFDQCCTRSCWNATAPGAYQTEPCPDMPNLAFRTVLYSFKGGVYVWHLEKELYWPWVSLVSKFKSINQCVCVWSPTVFSQCSWMVFFRSYSSSCVLFGWRQHEKQDLATWKAGFGSMKKESLQFFCLRTGLPQNFARRLVPGGSIQRATSKGLRLPSAKLPWARQASQKYSSAWKTFLEIVEICTL